MNPFKGRHFQRDIILWAVRWYCKYGISYRELQEMLAERGVNVDHSTIYRWVQRYAPEMEKRLRWYWRNPSDLCPWHMDETYVKVNGRWAYLYRAVDSRGRTVDFYLSSRRNSKAAYRFLGKILNNVKKWQIPRFINTDKAPAYGRALALLKREGRCPSDVEHRQIKYRNNVIECDHGKLKRIILNDIARGQSDPRKIVLQWDEMIRTAGSLKLGKVQVSVLVRSLLKSERPSGLTQAIIEVGRINKTLYLLNYILGQGMKKPVAGCYGRLTRWKGGGDVVYMALL